MGKCIKNARIQTVKGISFSSWKQPERTNTIAVSSAEMPPVRSDIEIANYKWAKNKALPLVMKR